ncbi:hypothetical protein L6452_05292 [Arctium lappa]|uniref:Uncharacterized protein n=1 Tax=Arctium lappa TaxID=4217 RepID=A0ACB9EFJ7_ARCLA|nr:hypothetical protein L6452_05292 [Arctium lappa]
MEESVFSMGDCYPMNETYVNELVGSSNVPPITGNVLDDDCGMDSSEKMFSDDEDDGEHPDPDVNGSGYAKKNMEEDLCHIMAMDIIWCDPLSCGYGDLVYNRYPN